MKQRSHSGALVLPQPMEKILIEIRERIGDDVAQAFREAFQATERAADDCVHHANFSQAIALICAQPKPLHERLDAIDEVINLPKGYVTLTLPRPT